MAALPPTWQTASCQQRGEGGMVGVSVFTSSPSRLTTEPLLVTEICQLLSYVCVCVCLIETKHR